MPVAYFAEKQVNYYCLEKITLFVNCHCHRFSPYTGEIVNVTRTSCQETAYSLDKSVISYDALPSY